ncbi:MAG: hypothetical protein OEY96_07190, partial [Gammaproteobacteria bacterium]|nr:hypothetical protein [Gammaproteobacteria bacterium]
MKQGNKGLTLREYQEKRHSDLELTPKKVSNWVRNLPVTNLANSSKIIYHVLIDVNHSAMEADDRLDILNTIETIACELITSLESQFIQKSINLSDKQKKIVALIQAIHTELCLGYHTVIEAVESDDPKRSHKKLLHTALTMAIRYHALVILKCLTLYAAVPNRIWREVYIIFQIAQKHGLDKKEFTVSHSDETFSIYNHFVRVLLLSISNTCQLRQQDIILTWELLPKIIEHVTLMTHAYNKHHFVVPMIPEEAGPPIHKSIYKSRHNTIERPVNLKLTAYTAVDHIKHLIESTQETDNQANRKIMIYKHLIQTWQTSVHRAFNRNACSESLHISIGLSATHYQLSQIVSAESTNVQATAMDAMEGSLKNASIMHTSHRPQKITQSKMNYLSSSSAPDEDVWARLYTTKEEMRSALNRMDPNKRSKEVIARESYQLRKVDVIDVSPNGYCIQINAENLPSNAQSGEIIGFLDTQSKDLHAGIGLIRWVRR